MTLRSKKRLLIMAAVLLTACGIGALALSFVEWPMKSADVQPPRYSSIAMTQQSEIPTESQARKISAQDLQAYWQRPLRRVLFDPPPPPPKVVEKPPPRPVTTRLLATMIEPGNTMAMLQLSTGEVIFRKVGDELGANDADVKITAIEEGAVKVIRQNDETKLSIAGQGRN